ncbi:hypothetical protein [Taibaiella soli]|uniref:Uncharacterized protein n=1 Tax=Taibaiella soli TaxID=1649169 RepID=A0A2W2BGF7_9BACT|nr:hypothetical protein [Taibaiella soli]PZF72586.1 hypothetical protein DN068_12025 [Taibaiella soli]
MEQQNKTWWQQAAVEPAVKEKWYNDKFKLGLSVLLWPVLLYGLYKTDLISNKSKWIFGSLIAVIVFFSYITPSTPVGKSWVTANATAEYDLGNTSGQGDNFLNYNQIFFDGMGNPINSIHRTGTFTMDGKKTVRCSFNDGMPPYELQYGKVDGRWCISDGSGNLFYYDDPKQRK